MTRFKAIRSQSERIVGIWNNKGIQTLEVDPEIVRVKDLEFADYMGGRIEKPGVQDVRTGVTHWT